jgi:hypothetical protein
MSSLALIVGDLWAFPAALAKGERQRTIEKQALNFARSLIRVAFASGVASVLYKGQHYYNVQRKFTIPVLRLAMTAARIPLSIEPIALAINIGLIASSASIFRKGIYSIWLMIQIFNPMGMKKPRPFFSAVISKDTLKIDPYSILANFALNYIPEAQLGTGFYLTIFGISQLASFSFARVNFQEAPTELALKGVMHIVIGLDCLGMYEKNSEHLEQGENKKTTWIYQIAEKVSPGLVWLTT